MKNSDFIRIRAYEAADAETLLDIWLAASRRGHAFLSESVLAEQMALVRDIYLPKAENWVALAGERPVGFIGLLGSFIGGLFVDPQAHGLGVGAALVRHAAALHGDLELEVYAANLLAPGFYRHMGFVETGRRFPDDDGRPLELIRMARKVGN